MAMSRRLWSVNGLAVELNRDRRTIADAVGHLPPDGKSAGRPAWFMTTAVRALTAGSEGDGTLDPAQERARKDRALAIQTELRNALTQSEVVRIDDVIQQVNEEHQIVRAHFLALPVKVATRFPQEFQARIEATTRELLYEAMEDFSTEKVVTHAKRASKRGSR